MIFMDKIERKFAFVLASAKRARQLQGGAKPLVQTSARKHTRIAMEEVAAGQVPYEVPDLEAMESKPAKGTKVKKKK